MLHLFQKEQNWDTKVAYVWSLLSTVLRQCFLFVASAHAEVLSTLDHVFINDDYILLRSVCPRCWKKGPAAQCCPHQASLCWWDWAGLTPKNQGPKVKQRKQSLRLDQSETFCLSPWWTPLLSVLDQYFAKWLVISQSGWMLGFCFFVF